MNTFLKKLPLLLAGIVSMSFFSCKKNGDDWPDIPISLSFQFEQMVDGNPLDLDTLMYVTSLGNEYMVTDIQYFISDIIFHKADGQKFVITDGDSIHYVDGRIVSTQIWNIVKTQLPEGMYDSISFTFGMNDQRNRSNRFLNPPERDMFWPEILGGGYHYMKLNLKWKDCCMQEAMPFMFHLGIGQLYSSVTPDVDSITGYVQNFFTVNLPVSSFTLESGHICTVAIRMNIEDWFDGQNAFDFALYPMGIMQDQEGMHRACLNGRNAFTCQISLVKLM